MLPVTRLLAGSLALLCLVGLPSASPAVTKILGAGEMLLMRDAAGKRYGAVKILKVNPSEGEMVFRWHLLPESVFDLGDARVRGGTVEIRQVQGRAVLAFGPFVLEWHGGTGDKGIISANGSLGVSPLLVASSALKEATRIKDARAGFLYEEATTREVPDRLGLLETFANLPKARVGIGVAQTFSDLGRGVNEPVLQVSRIDENSNAFKAGLRRDHCILSFDGLEVATPQDFHDMLQGVRPGDTVALMVYTGDEVKEFRFEAESRVSPPPPPPTPTPDPNLPPDQRSRLQAGEEVRQMMQQTMEAIRALHFD